MLRYGTTKYWMKNKLIVYILFRELSKRNRRRIRSLARYANCGISGRSINSSTPSTLSSSLPLSSPHLPHSVSSASRGQFLVLRTCYQSITRVNFFWRGDSKHPDCSSVQEGLKELAGGVLQMFPLKNNLPYLLQAQQTIRWPNTNLLTTATSHPPPISRHKLFMTSVCLAFMHYLKKTRSSDTWFTSLVPQ